MKNKIHMFITIVKTVIFTVSICTNVVLGWGFYGLTSEMKKKKDRHDSGYVNYYDRYVKK